MGCVVHIRNLTLGEGLPKICIPLTDTDFHSLQRSAQTILAGPCDLVEWRADFYTGLREENSRTEVLQMLRETLGEIPILFTIRTTEEGGKITLSAEEYEQINHSVIETGLADLVDVELTKGADVMTRLCEAAHLTSADGQVQSSAVRIIASKHDFTKTPPESEIVDSLCQMQHLGADIAKYAVMPNSDRDVLTLISATMTMKEKHTATPVITMSMGQRGVLSRICGSLSGSCVTFGTSGQASAPGQLPAETLKLLLDSLA